MNQEFSFSSMVFGEILSYKYPPTPPPQETRILEKRAYPRKLIWIMFWIKCIYLEKEIIIKYRITVLFDKVKFYVVYTLSEKLLLRVN